MEGGKQNKALMSGVYVFDYETSVIIEKKTILWGQLLL